MTVRRRPLRRDDLHLETTLTRYAQLAPEIELGWTQLRQAMRDAGWPARTPTDDRRPSTSGGDAGDDVQTGWLCS